MTRDYILAGRPDIDIGLLEELAKSSCPRVRRRVAENPLLPMHLISDLAKDFDDDVRLAIGTRRYCPLYILEMLVTDHSLEVRYGLAEDPLIPKRLLKHLTKDENPYIAERAKETLQKLHAHRIEQKHSLAVRVRGTRQSYGSTSNTKQKAEMLCERQQNSDLISIDFTSDRSPMLQRIIAKARKHAIKGKYEAAYDLYKIAVEQSVKEFGEDSPSYALVLLELADLCESIGMVNELYGIRCKIRTVIKQCSLKVNDVPDSAS